MTVVASIVSLVFKLRVTEVQGTTNIPLLRTLCRLLTTVLKLYSQYLSPVPSVQPQSSQPHHLFLTKLQSMTRSTPLEVPIVLPQIPSRASILARMQSKAAEVARNGDAPPAPENHFFTFLRYWRDDPAVRAYTKGMSPETLCAHAEVAWEEVKKTPARRDWQDRFDFVLATHAQLYQGYEDRPLTRNQTPTQEQEMKAEETMVTPKAEVCRSLPQPSTL